MVPEVFNLDLCISYSEFRPVTSTHLFWHDKEESACQRDAEAHAMSSDELLKLHTASFLIQSEGQKNPNQPTTSLRPSLSATNLTNFYVLNLPSVLNSTCLT